MAFGTFAAIAARKRVSTRLVEDEDPFAPLAAIMLRALRRDTWAMPTYQI